MGKVDTGILGEIRKKVGPVVGRKWRNLNVIAKYQSNVRNPRTDRQQRNRLVFKTISKLASNFGEVLKIGFSVVTDGTKVPPRAKFIKENFKQVVAVDPTSVSINYVDLIIASGSLPAVDCETPDFTTALTVKVSQNDTSDLQGASADDKVSLVVLDKETNQVVMSEPMSRTESDLVVRVPASWNGHDVYVWVIAWSDGDDLTIERVMDSIYLGAGVIQ